MRLDLEPDDVTALAGLLDAAVKSLGLRAVKDAARLLDLIERAAAQAEQADLESPNGVGLT